MEALAARKEALCRAWLARTLATYPEPTARVLAREGDPFRNPVGEAFRETLPRLLDAVLAGAEPDAAAPLVERLVRIRAVQDFTPARAVGFLFLLKDILQESGDEGGGAAVDRRIDGLALQAFDAFARCREELAAIQVRDARRRLDVLLRAQGAEPTGAPTGAA